MKKSILLVLCLYIATVNYSQDTCKSLKKENEYLKRVLKIQEPIQETEFDKTKIKITKVEGNIKTQSITITFIFENKDVNKYISLDLLKGLDLDGEEYGCDKYAEAKGMTGGNGSFGAQLNTEVPKKGELTLVKVPKSVIILKLLSFRYYSDILKSDRKEIEFRDLKVDWK